jgi:prepilin peptidase CpaA
MTPAVWQIWCFTALSLLLMVAVESDICNRRIPNVVVLLMLCCGIALNVMGPPNGRAGMFAYFPGALGASGAFLGVVVGLAFFMPMYWLRAMGAGDVKLMAGLGSFVGPIDAFSVGLCILVSGGFLSVVRMLWVRKTRLVFANVMLMLGSLVAGTEQQFDPLKQSADRMPYALAFAGGLLSYSYWRLSGGPAFISF